MYKTYTDMKLEVIGASIYAFRRSLRSRFRPSFRNFPVYGRGRPQTLTASSSADLGGERHLPGPRPGVQDS